MQTAFNYVLRVQYRHYNLQEKGVFLAYANDVNLLLKIPATTVALLENVLKYALVVVMQQKSPKACFVPSMLLGLKSSTGNHSISTAVRCP